MAQNKFFQSWAKRGVIRGYGWKWSPCEIEFLPQRVVSRRQIDPSADLEGILVSR